MTDTNIDDIGLIIDYDQPTARLFTDLAKGILQCAAAGGLAILSVPHGTSELAATGDINPHGMWNVVQRLMLLDADSSNKSQDSPPIEFPLSKPAADDFSGTMDMMLGRRLMWSRDGYFGAVPAEAKKGDAIMLIQGCPVPLVVREVAGDVLGEGEESGQKWQLIGDCFVHGAMYGERWKTELCGKVLFV
ncbi:hypothetical protein QBC39DRAFT_386949 [Podospora conica]|nr:hypothetical protein QBC39DRAFT_386949 [Schizothecium conicum]